LEYKRLLAARVAIAAAVILLPTTLLVGSIRTHHVSLKKLPLRVTVIDVGEGDSILVRTPTGRTMLIDGGGDRSADMRGGSSSESPIGEKRVVPFLRSEGVAAINVLVITHPHGDHVGGLTAVVRDIPVGTVLDGTALPYRSDMYRTLMTQIRAKQIPYNHARRGETIDFGDGVHADVLNPPNALIYGNGLDDKTINNYSAVLRVSYGTTAFLFDGDAETEAEHYILSNYSASYLHCDLLKAGHHGSRNASSDDWLSAVRPTAAIISCGLNNVFGHPHPEALARLRAHNIAIYRTDMNGSVEADSDGTKVTVSTDHGGPG
jgi:beta-lactamase superfamily II metal-dependent hydrolase